MKTTKDDEIDEKCIDHAKIIGKNIMNSSRAEKGITNVMNDHSLSNHEDDDSYFASDNRDQIKNLIGNIVNEADDFKFKLNKNDSRLVLSKQYSTTESQQLLSNQCIGYDNGTPRNRAVACFGINGISNISDSINKGKLFTAFPVRDNYRI